MPLNSALRSASQFTLLNRLCIGVVDPLHQRENHTHIKLVKAGRPQADGVGTISYIRVDVNQFRLLLRSGPYCTSESCV